MYGIIDFEVVAIEMFNIEIDLSFDEIILKFMIN